MIISKIEIPYIEFGTYGTGIEDVRSNTHKSVFEFKGGDKEFSCNMNYLPEALQEKFFYWVQEVEKFITEKIE